MLTKMSGRKMSGMQMKGNVLVLSHSMFFVKYFYWGPLFLTLNFYPHLCGPPLFSVSVNPYRGTKERNTRAGDDL